MTITQPVPAPATWEDFFELFDSGVLIDMAGRPLTRRPCDRCGKRMLYGGHPCIYCDVACPKCESRKGRTRCLRPSGHEASEPHAERETAVAALAEEWITAGVDTIAAPWPAAKPQPAPKPRAESEQLTLTF